MSNNLSAAKSLASKLEEWSQTLPQAEQEVLLGLIQVANQRFSDAIGDSIALNSADPDKELVEEARAALERFEPDASGVVPLTGTCITVTTVTTSLQSSRWLC